MNSDCRSDTTLGAGASIPVVTSAPGDTPPADPMLDLPKKTDVWGTEFAQLDMRQTIQLADQIVQARRPEFFVTANLNYLMLTEQHPRLSVVNQRSAAVIADGHPIVIRSRLSPNPLPCRVAGSDMIVELAKLSADRGYRMFFLGAAPGVAQSAADELRRRFPKLQIAGCTSPPFRPLTSAEHTDMLAQVRDAGTDILLVAFGQPKGEFWIYDHLHELSVPLSIQLGASFDFLAGTAQRAPKVWQLIGCEWLYRAMSDPRRLAPRYARNLLFLARKVAAELIGFFRQRKRLDESPA